jgi:hypothetical protein
MKLTNTSTSNGSRHLKETHNVLSAKTKTYHHNVAQLNQYIEGASEAFQQDPNHIEVINEEKNEDDKEDGNTSEDVEIIIQATALYTNNNIINSNKDEDVPDSFLQTSTAVAADSQDTCSPAQFGYLV